MSDECQGARAVRDSDEDSRLKLTHSGLSVDTIAQHGILRYARSVFLDSACVGGGVGELRCVKPTITDTPVFQPDRHGSADHRRYPYGLGREAT